MLSPIGRKMREDEEKENPKPVIFGSPSVSKLSTPATQFAPSVDRIVNEPLTSIVNRTVSKNAPMSRIPRRSREEVLNEGLTISQGTEDPSRPSGRDIPFIGQVLFGRDKNKVYDPSTFAGQVEKKGIVGFFTEGFQNVVNPSREVVANRVMERYDKLVAEGMNEEEAIDKAITDTVNRTLATRPGMSQRAIDEIKATPTGKLTEDEEAALFWINTREKLFAVLDAPIFLGTTKAIKAGGETVTPLVKDQIIERLGQGASRADDPTIDRQIELYMTTLKEKDQPSLRDLNRGIELLRTSGRQYDDLQADLAKRTRETMFGPEVTEEVVEEAAPVFDARLRTNREVPMRDIAGNRFTVPAETVLSPRLDGNRAIIEVGGQQYTIPKNQYDNLKGQSVREVATPFAPELEKTTETVRGAITKKTLTKDEAIREIANGKSVYGIDESGADSLIEGLDDVSRFNTFSLDEDFIPGSIPTRYEKYTLPGGQNYREILIQAPGENAVPEVVWKQTDDGAMSAEVDGLFFGIKDEGSGGFYVYQRDGILGKTVRNYTEAVEEVERVIKERYRAKNTQYQSPHWSEPNVISHIRANERVAENGERHFFLEEIQSDWARDGRQKGFDEGISTDEAMSLLPKGWKVTGNGDTYQVVDETGKVVPSKLPGDTPGEKAFGGNTRAALGRALGDPRLMGNYRPGVAYNEALDNWQVLTLKRALIEADRSGADRFTWINGEQTKDRYKLSTQVQDIVWGKSDFMDVGPGGVTGIKLNTKQSGKRFEFSIDEKGIIRSIEDGTPRDWIGRGLDDVLGKGLADNIMSKSNGKLEGDGLNIGGEWANNLYDRQVRDIVKKLTGAKIEEVDLGLTSALPDAWKVVNEYRGEYQLGELVSKKNLKVGMRVGRSNGSSDRIVTSIGEDGTAYAVDLNLIANQVDNIDQWLSDLKNPGQYAKRLAEKNNTTVDDPWVVQMVGAREQFIRNNAEHISGAGKKLGTQMSIRLTPEVKARIGSKAPDVTVTEQDARAYSGVPLIFTAFDQEAAEAGISAGTGLPEGISEDEEGNIVVDPKKAFLGMAAAGIIGYNFSRNKGSIQSKQVAPDGASSRLDQRVPLEKTPLPKAGQTRYPMASSQFSDSLSTSYQGITGETVDNTLDGLAPGTVDPSKIKQYSKFRKAMDEAWVSTVEAVQDNLYRVRRLVQDPNVKVSDDTDPYLAELLFHGRIGARLTEARETVIAIDKDIVETARKVGIPDSDMTLLVNKYLHARHTPERNARLGDGAAGLTNAEAEMIMTDIDALPYAAEVKRVSERVAEMNGKTLDVLREAQVIDQEAYDAMRNAYRNHVPLQRIIAENQDVTEAITGRGFDVRSSGIKRAKGSDLQVADILANVVTNYEQALIRAEKNRVDLATLAFVRDNPQLSVFEEFRPKVIGRMFDRPVGAEQVPVEFMDRPMPPAMEPAVDALRESIEEGWGRIYMEMDYAEAGQRGAYVYTDDSGIIEKITSKRSTFPDWVPDHLRSKKLFNKVMDLHMKGKVPRQNAVKERELLEVMEERFFKTVPLEVQDEMALAYLSRESEVMESIYTKSKARGKLIYESINDPRVLTLRENGKPVYIRIKDEKLAVALKGVNKQYLPAFVRFVGAFTRLYSGLQTRFNPEFAFPNKIRDLQEAVVYAGSRGELGFKGGVQGALDQRAYLDVLDHIRGIDSEGAKLYKQMIDDGGTTGGMALSTREQIELDIDAIRKMNRSNPRKAAEMLINSIDKFNQVFEDSTRLSLYKQALKRGVSRKRAAMIAKEASVNFNKFGTGGPVLNALWMFSNASIQGTTKMLRAMRNPKVAAVVTSSVGSAVWAAGEWNDRIDPQWREKTTAWDRNNALVLVLPPQESDNGEKFNYIAIPVGWGIKPIKVSMDYAYDALTGRPNSILDVMNGIGAATINAYNPLGGTDVFSSVTPTILDIPAEIARNKAWHGGKIMPDWDQNAPDSIRYFSSLQDNTTGQIAIQASEGLSGLGIEVSPASLYYAYQGYVGGAGRTATDFVNTMITVGRGELPESNDIPVWSRFVKIRDNEEIGVASKEYEQIKERLSEQSRERFYLNQDAENSHRQLSSLPAEEAAALFDDIAAADPDLAKKIADIVAEEKLGVTYTQRLIKQLGVANGERAQFIYDKLQTLETPEEKAALWDEYVEKKIITQDVSEQLLLLLQE